MSSFQLIFEWHERCIAEKKCKMIKSADHFDIIADIKYSPTNSSLFRKHFTDNTGFRNYIDYICYRCHLGSARNF